MPADGVRATNEQAMAVLVEVFRKALMEAHADPEYDE